MHSFAHLLAYHQDFKRHTSNREDYAVEVPLARLLEWCPFVSKATVTHISFSLCLGLLSNRNLKEFLCQLATDARTEREKCRTVRGVLEEVQRLTLAGEQLFAQSLAREKTHPEVIEEAQGAFRA